MKVEAYEKLKRKVQFNTGIDFHTVEGDVDESKRVGAEGFRRVGQKMEVIEMNLDEKQLAEIKARK